MVVPNWGWCEDPSKWVPSFRKLAYAQFLNTTPYTTTVRYKALHFKIVRLALLFVKLINEPHTTSLCKIGKRNLTPEQASQTMKPQDRDC